MRRAPLLLLSALLFLTPLATVLDAQARDTRAVQHFGDCLEQSGENPLIVALPSTVTVTDLDGETSLEDGDEIAVFTEAGVCAGAGVWTGDDLTIRVANRDAWYDDERAFEDGDPLFYRVWNASTGTMLDVEPEVTALIPSGADVDPNYYAGNHLYSIGALHASGSVGTSTEMPVVDGFELADPFPNPFTSRATLRLTLARAQHVRAEVFDLTGRRVAMLHDGPAPASTPLDLRVEGDRLAAGVYVARVVGEDFTAARRLVLAR